MMAGCAIFSTNVAEVSSAHCCLALNPAATLKAIIHFASRIAHCHRPAEGAVRLGTDRNSASTKNMSYKAHKTPDFICSEGLV
jgi:hypothetical protein